MKEIRQAFNNLYKTTDSELKREIKEVELVVIQELSKLQQGKTELNKEIGRYSNELNEISKKQEQVTNDINNLSKKMLIMKFEKGQIK